MGNYAISMFKDVTKNEQVAVISVNANRRVKWSDIISKGSIDSSEIDPCYVVEKVLKHKVKTIILAHNHPNGTLAPSIADKEATEALVKIFKSIGIEVLDHIIVSGTRYFSMKEAGFRF